MKFRDTIILDTETTGLLVPEASLLEHQPYITELYAMRVDHKGNLIDEFETFFKVPVPLEKHIIKLTGITDNMLQGAPEFAEEYKNLVEFFMGTRRMVAHNLPFDAGMLWAELSRIGKEFMFPWPPEYYCTIEKSFHIENKRIKLSRLHEHATGKEFKEGAHRAKQDVFALKRCYDWLVEERNDGIT